MVEAVPFLNDGLGWDAEWFPVVVAVDQGSGLRGVSKSEQCASPGWLAGNLDVVAGRGYYCAVVEVAAGDLEWSLKG